MALRKLVSCAAILAAATALFATVAAAQGPVRVGGDIKEPTRTKWVPPVYPAIALRARVSGTVIIEAVIGTDGRVTQARALRPMPLLEAAAVEAVRQWEYTPTLLNGAPVEVIMTVVVNFTLSPGSRPPAGSEPAPATPDAAWLKQLETSPNDLVAMLELAKIYRRANRFSEAEQMLQRALDQLRTESSASSNAPKPIVVPPGYVIIEVTVAKDGAVQNVRLIKGDPSLAAAALEAVRKTRYTPTFVNGSAVEGVITMLVPIKAPGR